MSSDASLRKNRSARSTNPISLRASSTFSRQKELVAFVIEKPTSRPNTFIPPYYSISDCFVCSLANHIDTKRGYLDRRYAAA